MVNRLPSDDKIIAVAHSAHGLHDIALIVFDDLDTFQVLHRRIGRQLIKVLKHQYRDVRLTMPREKHHFAMYAEFVCETRQLMLPHSFYLGIGTDINSLFVFDSISFSSSNSNNAVHFTYLSAQHFIAND